eukprot:3287210-Rhodomonas_salina.1
MWSMHVLTCGYGPTRTYPGSGENSAVCLCALYEMSCTDLAVRRQSDGRWECRKASRKHTRESVGRRTGREITLVSGGCVSRRPQELIENYYVYESHSLTATLGFALMQVYCHPPQIYTLNLLRAPSPFTRAALASCPGDLFLRSCR